MRSFSNPAGSITFLVNFPAFVKMCLEMIKAGSGYTFEFEALAPGTDLRKHESVMDLIDIGILPKAIGGDATSVGDDGKEVDDRNGEDVYVKERDRLSLGG